jgi:hypothetical protein
MQTRIVVVTHAAPIMVSIAKLHCKRARVDNIIPSHLAPRTAILVDVGPRERRCLRIRSERDGAAGASLSGLAGGCS